MQALNEYGSHFYYLGNNTNKEYIKLIANFTLALMMEARYHVPRNMAAAQQRNAQIKKVETIA